MKAALGPGAYESQLFIAAQVLVLVVYAGFAALVAAGVPQLWARLARRPNRGERHAAQS